MTFVACHFPEHYNAPIDILMWLYDMAEYRDEVAAAARREQNRAKTILAGKKGGKARPESSDDEVDMEDTTFSIKSHKDFKKTTAAKKPAAPPSKPVFGAGKQLTEAQKEEERQKKLK
jgi:hypothetical protein